MAKTYHEVIQESSLARVQAHTEGRNIGMITAHRAENTSAENHAKNKELEGHIRKSGYGFVKVKGRYVENHGTPQAKNVDEKSYLVVGKKGEDHHELKHFLKKHGSAYGQDSILHKAHNETTAKLHGTKEGGWPGKDVEHDVGHFHANRAGEFHTKMKGKRTFAFESVEFLTPVTFSSRVEGQF
jgi:hypothetical protein